MSWSGADVAAIVALVEDRTGLTFGSGRHNDAEAGIRRAFERLGRGRPTGLDGYRAALSLDPALLDDLVDELTVQETYFFREPWHFELVRDELLGSEPSPYARRVWCAGCASGEEPYSLAIMLEEAGIADRVSILATDISRAALARARTGAYRPWSFRGVEPAVIERWFQRVGEVRVVDPRIRARVTFEHLNLALDVFPSFANHTFGLDLIVCRNVLIYLGRATIRAIAERFFDALLPGGLLIPGPSDPPLGDLAPFETVLTPAGLVYRRPHQVASRPVLQPLWEEPSPLPSEPPSRAEDVEPFSRPFAALSAAPPAAAIDEALDPDADRGRSHGLDLAGTVRAVRDLADTAGLEAAEVCCAQGLERHPLSAELHYLAALFAIGLGREEDALSALRRTLYIDRTLAVAHFMLGELLRRRGDLAPARRAFGHALRQGLALPPDALLPLGDGERAGALVREAERQLAWLAERRGPINRGAIKEGA